MDVPKEWRAWQILQSNYREPLDGKKQDCTSIIAEAMIVHYDREEEKHLTNEELLVKVQESIKREAGEIKKNFPQTPFPMMYSYMPMMPGVQNAAVQPGKQKQEQAGTQQNEEIINDADLDFMDSFMGI